MKAQALSGVLSAPKYLADMLPDNVSVAVDLSANENLLGPSSSAIQAYQEAAKEIWRYPDGGAKRLKQAIAEVYALDPNRIVCGAGSDELLTLLTRAFVAPGDEVLFPDYSFVMYQINAIRVGAKVVRSPTLEFVVDVDALLARVSHRTKVVFLANPNNPTGTYLKAESIQRLIAELPAHVVLVLDAAYAEYIDDPDYASGEHWVEQHPNVVMLRTFSKIHGLAGLRLGWSYAQEEITDILERSRGPYNISLAAQMAGIQAIQDQAHVRLSRQHNQQWLLKVSQGFRALGWHVTDSAGNFVLVDFLSKDTAQCAYQHFLESGILTRPLRGYNLPHHLRITIGKETDNLMLLQACQTMALGNHASRHGVN